jgi:hypothetical protein
MNLIYSDVSNIKRDKKVTSTYFITGLVSLNFMKC